MWISVFRKLRRKIYYKIRFKNWYRKYNYRRHKKGQIDEIIARYKTPEEMADKKYMRALRRDMNHCLQKFGSYYDEYFNFGFEGQDDAYRDSFITEGIRLSYYPRMNDPKNTNMLENKYLTYKKFQDMFKRDMICIRQRDEMTEEMMDRFREFTGKDREDML